MNIMRFIISISFLALLVGCVGIGAPISSPYMNSLNAAALLDNGRPFPAERLIEISIEKSNKSGNQIDLGISYDSLANFLTHPTIYDWKKHYQKHGILDSQIDFENRYAVAKDYLLKAIDLFQNAGGYAYASNSYFDLAVLEANHFEDLELACRHLDQSLAMQKKFKELNPEEEIRLSDKYSSFEEFIEYHSGQINCQ